MSSPTSNNRVGTPTERRQRPLDGSNPSHSPPAASTTLFQAAAVSAGPELINDRNGLPPAPGMVEENRATAASSSSVSVCTGSGIVENVLRFGRALRKREKKARRPSLPQGDDDTSAPVHPAQIPDIEADETPSEKLRGAPETMINAKDDEPPAPVSWSNATIMKRKEALPSSGANNTQQYPRTTPGRDEEVAAPHLPQQTSDRPQNFTPPPVTPPNPLQPPSVSRLRNDTPPAASSSVPPTVDDATVVQGGEATPVYVATVVRQESIVQEDPSLESTDSQDEEDKTSTTESWWRAHRKLLIVGLISVVFGAMAATIGVLLGSQNGTSQKSTGNDGDGPSEMAQSFGNGGDTSSAIALAYYADRGNHCCVNEKGRQPHSDDNRGGSFFPTVEQCCETELWFLNDGVCIMNSESLSALSDTQLSSLTWTQEGETLNGDAVEVLYDGGFFGRSMCLSNDGMTLVIGAPGYYDTTVGYVRVYRKEDKGWKQRGHTIRSASANDYFGRFVSVSADGEFVAIGARGLQNSDLEYESYAQIYGWDEANGLYQQKGQFSEGSVVSLSADAKTLAIGDHFYKEWSEYTPMFVGRVTVYRWNDSEFKKQGYIPNPNNGESVNGFRYYMSLSSNGNTLALGIVHYSGGSALNSSNGSFTGAVKVYHKEYEDSSWTQLGDTLTGDGRYFGNSVSLSGDGKTLAIGDPPGGSTDIGQVKVYRRNDELDSNFKLLGATLLGDRGHPTVGSPVSLSSDGKTLVVGDSYHFDDNSGRVKIYNWDEDALEFMQRGNSVNGKLADGELGCSVTVSSNGKTWAAGACRSGANGQDSGQVVIYSAEY